MIELNDFIAAVISGGGLTLLIDWLLNPTKQGELE